jgi:dihydrofolate synthase/folylpolyglutamate synthase
MIDDAIRWLYGLQQFGIKLGLEGIRALLDRLDRPETALPSILVGGTNGKGSVAAMLESMLGAVGLRVGLFTSPHLVHPRERIRIAGRDIAPSRLAARLEEIRRLSERMMSEGRLPAHPSFFEVMTAAAWAEFRDERLDAAIVEVGLGGRLDATNASPASVSVIVTIDLDHTDRLGATIAEIASEKAGIVKHGRPLVSGVVQPEAVAVLRDACARADAPLLEAREIATLGSEIGPTFTIRTPSSLYDHLELALRGKHQRDNARVAIVALETFLEGRGVTASREAVRDGLARTRWAGRLQTIAGRPALLLDGAHNPAGAAALAENLAEREGPRPVLVFGALRAKDVRGILAPLAPHVACAVLTKPSVERAEDPAALAPIAASLGISAEVVPDVRPALERASQRAGADGLVLVAGSLYLVGDVLASLEGGTGPGPVPL